MTPQMPQKTKNYFFALEVAKRPFGPAKAKSSRRVLGTTLTTLIERVQSVGVEGKQYLQRLLSLRSEERVLKHSLFRVRRQRTKKNLENQSCVENSMSSRTNSTILHQIPSKFMFGTPKWTQTQSQRFLFSDDSTFHRF